MSTGTVAIPTEPTPAEQLSPGALSAYAAELVPTYRRNAGLPDRQEWTTLAGMANTFAASGMLPKGLQGRASSIMAIFLKGRDLGLSPTEALYGIDMIEGMPTLKAHTMSALIKRAGHRLWYEETSRDQASIVGQRLERWGRDGEPVYGPEIRLTWTIQDAIDAKLVTRKTDGSLEAKSQSGASKPWMLYPAAMLRARALTALARMEFSDVLMGAWYSPEELGAEVDADGKVIRLPQGQEAIAAFESLMERKPEHTGGDEAREPDEVQSPRPPEAAIRDGENLSGQLDKDVIDVQAEPPAEPPSREELWAELEEQARVLAGGSIPRHTARAVAAYKANPDDWSDEQLAEFVTGRRGSYQRYIAEHVDDAPQAAECPGDGCPGCAGCQRGDDGAPTDQTQPDSTEPAAELNDEAGESTPVESDTPGTPVVEDPPEGFDTLV